MNEPTYEQGPRSISATSPSSTWKSSAKEVPSVVAFIGVVLYGLGFVAANTSLAAWGIYDADPLRPALVVTGGLLLLFLLAASLPSVLYEMALKRHMGLPRHPRIAAGLVAFIAAMCLLIIVARQFSAVENEDTYRWFQPGRLTLTLLVALSVYGSGRALHKSLIIALSGVVAMRERISAMAFGSAALLLLFVSFPFVYIVMPPRFGGGEPVQKDVWFSKEARATLDSYGLCAGGASCSDQWIKIPNLWVLYSRGDAFVVCGDKRCDKALRVSKDWVKAEVWSLAP